MVYWKLLIRGLLTFKNYLFMKTKLIASSPSIEGITKVINAYFYTSGIRVEGENIINEKGKALISYRVTTKGRRFRFEQVPE